VFQLFPARLGEDVVLGAPVIRGGAPVGFDEALPLQAAEGGKQRAGVDLENAAADLLDAQADAIAVQWLQRQGLQDEHVERALNQLSRFGRHASTVSSRRSRGA